MNYDETLKEEKKGKPNTDVETLSEEGEAGTGNPPPDQPEPGE